LRGAGCALQKQICYIKCAARTILINQVLSFKFSVSEINVRKLKVA
jgi:hypothetical protein